MAMLKVENLSIKYGSIEAVKNVSFEVNEGEVVTLQVRHQFFVPSQVLFVQLREPFLILETTSTKHQHVRLLLKVWLKYLRDVMYLQA